MASLTIRNIDPATKDRLRLQAARHGRSIEAEARRILQTSLHMPAAAAEGDLFARIRARLDPLGGIDLELPPRHPVREPPRFD